jgi:hypothetical protein
MRLVSISVLHYVLIWKSNNRSPVSEEEILEEKKKQYEQMREKCKWMPEWKGKESLSWLGH